MDMKFLYRHGKLSLILLLSLSFTLIYITNHCILTLEFYQNNGNALSGIPGQDARVYEALQKWVYLTSAIWLMLRLGVIALILHTALYLHDHQLSFNSIFKITVLAEFLFLIPAAIKVISFNYTFEHGTLLDWHKYYILSALSLFNDVPADWFYALKSFNLFEFGYWFLLALGISKITKLGFDHSLRIVLISYVPGLLIWIAVVTFFTLMMFPATG